MYLQKFLNKLSNPISLRILFFLILGQSYSQQISVQDEKKSGEKTISKKVSESKLN